MPVSENSADTLVGDSAVGEATITSILDRETHTDGGTSYQVKWSDGKISWEQESHVQDAASLITKWNAEHNTE
jgi:hypothetical protein